MKHIGRQALDQLDSLLGELRAVEGLREKKRGVFYRKSNAFLHLHEDPSGLFADVKLAGDFERLRVTTRAEQRELVRRVRGALTPRPGT